MRDFQAGRGLRPSGVCDETTWTALVEAGWKLGDRFLQLTSPNLRGDDVAELQHALGRLGFDCGRVDGIFGPRTAHALEDFQHNCGVTADAVCGPDTLQSIHRVIGQTGTGPGVGAVRERERVRRGLGSLENCRVVVGQFGGLSALTRLIARELRHLGATVMSLDEPDALAQARAANHFGADVYLGFEAVADDHMVAHFYQVPTFESAGGRSLAELLHEHSRAVSLPNVSVAGMRLPILRETRMPAVLMSLGPIAPTLAAAPELAQASTTAINLWVTSRSG